MLLSSLVWLTSCPKDKDPQPEPKAEVTADAGSDQTVQIGQTVTLNGADSKDSKGTDLSYSWTFTAKPNGSTAALANTKQAKPTFVADLPGEYEVELTVSNANGEDKDKVKITAAGSTSVEAIVLEGEIKADRVLTNIVTDPNLPDYIANTDVTVSAKLTIQPGVVIAFAADKGIYFSNPAGALVAKGTSGQPIVFTGKTKTKGFWKGVMIYSSSNLNEIDYTEVSYAGGSALTGVSAKSNLVLYGNSSTPATAKITNSTFTNGNGYGLYVQHGAKLGAFSNNTSSNNAGTAAYVYADQLGVLDAASKFNTGNGYNGVQTEGDANSDTEATWPAFTDGSKYLVSADLSIESGVKIAPGATFEFAADKGLYVRAGEAYLIAKGTSGQKITFTGKDKTKGAWKGVMIYSFSTLNELDYIEVSYAGSSALTGVSAKSNLVLYGNSSTPAVAKITNSAFTYGNGYGLYVQNGATVNADAGTVNTYSNNTTADYFEQ